MSNSSHKFWNFSLRVYAKPEVADACLTLQNEYGLDVNLILLCCWYGNLEGELTGDLLNQAITYSGQWRQQVVQPLRDTRKWMKTQTIHCPQDQLLEFQRLRERVKGIELQSEKLQQSMLEQLATEKPHTPTTTAIRNNSARIDAINKNLTRMLSLSGIGINSEIEDLLAVVTNGTTAD